MGKKEWDHQVKEIRGTDKREYLPKTTDETKKNL